MGVFYGFSIDFYNDIAYFDSSFVCRIIFKNIGY